jgi:hypothetical protein
MKKCPRSTSCVGLSARVFKETLALRCEGGVGGVGLDCLRGSKYKPCASTCDTVVVYVDLSTRCTISAITSMDHLSIRLLLNPYFRVVRLLLSSFCLSRHLLSTRPIVERPESYFGQPAELFSSNDGKPLINRLISCSVSLAIGPR